MGCFFAIARVNRAFTMLIFHLVKTIVKILSISMAFSFFYTIFATADVSNWSLLLLSDTLVVHQATSQYRN